MRLIDADALETHEMLVPLGNGQYEYTEVVYKDDIDIMPTIESRKKGKWIRNKANVWDICNRCGDDGSLGWNFCPNCGADMREREEGKG